MASGIACRCPSKSLSLSQLMPVPNEAKSVPVGPPASEASRSPPSAARESETRHGTSWCAWAATGGQRGCKPAPACGLHDNEAANLHLRVGCKDGVAAVCELQGNVDANPRLRVGCMTTGLQTCTRVQAARRCKCKPAHACGLHTTWLCKPARVCGLHDNVDAQMQTRACVWAAHDLAVQTRACVWAA